MISPTLKWASFLFVWIVLVLLIHNYAGTDFVRNHRTEVCCLETKLFRPAFSKAIVDTSCIYTHIFPDTFYLPLEVSKTLVPFKFFPLTRSFPRLLLNIQGYQSMPHAMQKNPKIISVLNFGVLWVLIILKKAFVIQKPEQKLYQLVGTRKKEQRLAGFLKSDFCFLTAIH